MFELSDFPAPTAGVIGGTALLFSGADYGLQLVVLSLLWWLVGQYIAAGAEPK